MSSATSNGSIRLLRDRMAGATAGVDYAEMARRIKGDLEASRLKAEALRAEVRAEEARAARLARGLAGIVAVARGTDTADEAAAAGPALKPLKPGTHAASALTVLRGNGAPMQMGEILAKLTEAGHKMSAEYGNRFCTVRDSLVNHPELFVKLGRGRWGLVGRDG